MTDRLALITGWFGMDNSEMVQQLARSSGASWERPLYQEVEYAADRSRGQSSLTLPSYFIIFGSYRAIRWPNLPSTVPIRFEVGWDILDEMVPCSFMPSWAYTTEASPFVPHLGKVQMKHVNFERVAAHSFQISLWFGTSTPSKSSQAKCSFRSRGKDSKGKGKGKDFGKKG